MRAFKPHTAANSRTCARTILANQGAIHLFISACGLIYGTGSDLYNVGFNHGDLHHHTRYGPFSVPVGRRPPPDDDGEENESRLIAHGALRIVQ